MAGTKERETCQCITEVYIKICSDIWFISTIGFNEEAFKELSAHKDDPIFKNCTLVLDAMSVKSHIQYDPSLQRNFGFVDYGGHATSGESDVMATDSLVCMIVGMEGSWKLPVGYFLTKSITAEVQAGIIREALIRIYDSGISVRVCTMDGTAHNTSTYKNLGCDILVKNIDKMKVEFAHPHPSANYNVYGMLDPPHMAKLCRNLLAEYWELYWPSKGTVKWAYVVRLFDVQKEHAGLRLANKLTAKHIHYKKNKMKVNLAVQVASNSVAKALEWAYNNEVEGFTSPDVLVTSEYLSLHDKLWDILNSRSKHASGLKAALSVNNIDKAQVIFRAFEKMYDELIAPNGKKVIHSRRRTGPLGYISAIKTVEKLVKDMESGELDMQLLRCHKLQQDHLECFFSQVRQRNGWSYNPTPSQFRYAYRTLLIHKGKMMVTDGNCQPQDDTVMLSVCNTAARKKRTLPESDPGSVESSAKDFLEVEKSVADRTIHARCVIMDCRVCTASLAYIAGFYAMTMQKRIKCEECRDALVESPWTDQCTDKSLIMMKADDSRSWWESYNVYIPSGSLCKLLMLNEKVLRQNITLVSSNTRDLEGKLLIHVLQQVNDVHISPHLSVFHSLETSNGADNHYLLLVQLVSRKYLRLRIKTILKDLAKARTFGKPCGNDLHRKRMLYNA